MAAAESNPSADLAAADLAAENARLKAELAKLRKAKGDTAAEAEPARTLLDEATEERLKDAFGRNRKEADRIGRSLAYAAVESLHAQADALSAAADRLFKRHPTAKGGAKADDELVPGANDVAAAVSAALENAAGHGSRIVHRFIDAYDKGGKHP